MKHILITAIAAVVLVGCGPSVSIHDDAEDGNIEAVKQHLADGADVELKCMKCGGSVLGHAAGGGHKEISELLIAEGADVNAKSMRGRTPLHSAALNGHKETVELLIKKGADVNAKDKYGRTPLYEAATVLKEIVELLIAKGADVNVMDNQFGWTPLHRSSGQGHKEISELLIAEGADVNAKANNRWTPLHRAANKEIVELLIAEGADVNAKTANGGGTPLDVAIEYPQTETAAFLRKHGGKTGVELSIHKAAEAGNIEAVKQHLADGADVNAKDGYGSTPLHAAAYEDHKEIVELLIAEGADVNAKMVSGAKKGNTPIDAANDWNTETINLLRKHGGKTGEELKAK
jgi:ankyrin repeat protein